MSGWDGGAQRRQGWYPDPAGSGQVRWWDGGAWTDHLASPEQVTPEPLTGRRVGRVILIVLGGALLAKGATAWRYLLTSDDVTAYGLLAYGGKSILGGLFGAYVGALLTKRIVGIRHSTGDLFAPAVAAGMAVGRIGCLLTEPLGTPSTLPWAVALSPLQAASVTGCTVACTVPSHPSHAYEILFHLLALAAILAFGDRLGKRGVVFTVWLLAYGVFRLGNEFLRDNPEFWLGLSGSQVFLLLSVPLLARGLWRTTRQGLLRPPGPDQQPVLIAAPDPVGPTP